MKKFLLISCFCCFLEANNHLLIGDPSKGQIYFKFYVAPIIGTNGVVFTKKYTINEWKERFANGGKLLFDEFKLDKNLFNEETLNHLEAFCIEYAKDSDVSPNCGE